MSRKSKAAEFLNEAYNITITGRNVMVTEPMKSYAMEKIAKIERFSNRIIDVIVTMDVQKLNHRVDIFIKVDHLSIKSHADTDNMYASIDKAVDKLQAQLLRYKTKIQDHQAKAVKDIDLQVNVLQASPNLEVIEVNDEIEEANRKRLFDRFTPHKIVKKECCSLKTLTDGEAIMKMELSGDEFMIYVGEDTQQMKVIYPLKDGNFGVIAVEPTMANAVR
jgi:putative sigma-54 modulation protein